MEDQIIFEGKKVHISNNTNVETQLLTRLVSLYLPSLLHKGVGFFDSAPPKTYRYSTWDHFEFGDEIKCSFEENSKNGDISFYLGKTKHFVFSMRGLHSIELTTDLQDYTHAGFFETLHEYDITGEQLLHTIKSFTE